MTEQLLAAALAYAEAGLSVVPAQTDGTKRPAGFWKHHQTHRAGEGQVRAWLAGRRFDGYGFVLGAISGHAEMLELEGRAVAEGLASQLEQLLADNGHGGLWRRLWAGHVEATPSGGIHFLYRVAGTAERNTKLARRPSTPQELALEPDTRLQTLIETRGEGGFTVAAPSAGRTHPTGLPWSLLVGGPGTIPTITEDERDALYAIASLLDRSPAPEGMTRAAPGSTRGAGDTERPGDEWNAKATWEEILEPHGWKKVGRLGTGWTWRRPNKADGVSATTGTRLDTGDNLFVFSSSTDFDTERSYTKFGAYALLEHGGDLKKAARDLGKRGFGAPYQPPEHPRAFDGIVTAEEAAAPRPAPAAARTTPQEGVTSCAVPASAGTSSTSTVGALATVHQLDAPAADPDEPLKPHLQLVETYTQTDDGNAMRFADAYADELRYVPQRNRWLRRHGHRWQWDEADSSVELARSVARALPRDSEAAVKWRQQSLGIGHIRAMVDLARSDARMVVSAADLDGDPWALCTPAGVVDLDPDRRSGMTRPGDVLHTRTTRCHVDPEHPTPMWHAFLADTFGDGPDGEAMAAFVQRLAGYSATGAVTHHVLPFLFGSGGNGKNVFLDTLRLLLGDYASTANHGFLMAGREAHETEKARLSGLRMVVCSEVNEKDRFDEAKMKALTGGDAITARFLHQDFFTFEPTHHLWLMGNHQPGVAAGGESFWRRLRLVPFLRTVPPEKRVEQLAEKLVEREGPGILAWVVAGAREQLRQGLNEPVAVLAATKTYAEDEDPLGRFLEERCVLGGGALVKLDTKQLRSAYVAWCGEEGESPLHGQTFGRELRTRFQIESTASHGRRFYLGVALRGDDEPEE